MREFLAFVAVGAGTYFLRSYFILRGDQTQLPPVVEQGLKYVGPAVLSSLAAVAVAQGGGIVGIVVPRPESIGLVAAVAVAWWSKSVVLTVVVGFAVVWLLQGVMG